MSVVSVFVGITYSTTVLFRDCDSRCHYSRSCSAVQYFTPFIRILYCTPYCKLKGDREVSKATGHGTTVLY